MFCIFNTFWRHYLFTVLTCRATPIRSARTWLFQTTETWRGCRWLFWKVLVRSTSSTSLSTNRSASSYPQSPSSLPCPLHEPFIALHSFYHPHYPHLHGFMLQIRGVVWFLGWCFRVGLTTVSKLTFRRSAVKVTSLTTLATVNGRSLSSRPLETSPTTGFFSSAKISWNDFLLFCGFWRHCIYSCCAEPYPDVTFKIQIRRKPLFYVFNMILPCFIITFVALLGRTCSSSETCDDTNMLTSLFLLWL